MLDTRSCLPKRHCIGEKELEQVQRHLYIRLRHQVPPENKDLKNVLDTHAETNNGFAVLRSIFYHGSDMLDEYTSNFGPKRDKGKDPLLYAAEFQSQLQTNQQKHKTQYCLVEISLEFLNRAIEIDYKRTLATTLQEMIISWDEANQDKGAPYPDRFSLPTLASKLSKSVEPSTSGDQPSPNFINAVVAQVNAISSSTRTNSQINKIRGRYSKMNLEKNHKKQCQCCKRFGHDISDKTVCYFKALFYNAQQYLENHPDEMTKNASLVNSSDNPMLVNALLRQFDNDKTVDENDIEQVCIKQVIDIRFKSSTQE